jgi:TonB family protein
VNVKVFWGVVRVIGLCALIIGAASAGERTHPQFDRYVSPAYPSGLRGGKSFSSVRVNYDIHHDGSVRNVMLVEQTDQQSANATLSAVKRWRFKPWEVSADMPAEIGESVHVIFDEEPRERRLRMRFSWERREI